MNNLPLEPMPASGSMIVTCLLVAIATVLFLELRQWWNNQGKK